MRKTMKNLNFSFVAALMLGSLVFNSANVSAQTAITPIDPDNYQDGVEKFIGVVVPGTDDVRSFAGVGFTVPDNLDFNLGTQTLTVGEYYDLSDIIVVEDSILWLNVNFRPLSDAPFGDLLDTLVISVPGTADFTLPIRGTTTEFVIKTNGVWFPYPILPGDTSETITVSIVTVNQRPERFHYSFESGQAFTYEVASVTPGIPITTVTLGVQFEPPTGTSGKVFEDSLVVTHDSYPGVVYKIPVKGTVSHIDVNPHSLTWGPVPVGKAVIQDFYVRTQALITAITVEGDGFSYQTGSDWDPGIGGTIHVTFAPIGDGPFTGEVDLMSATDTVSVDLMGLGGETPVISSNPAAYDFGEVLVGQMALSQRITIVLSNPMGSFLSDPGAITIEDSEGVFFIETIQPGSYTTRPDTVYVTLSFTPLDEDEYRADLLVQADNAQLLPIPLFGIGIAASAPQLAPQQATAISAGEVAEAPVLSVREGDIIVSRAPAGSSIQVYNLQGQPLKTQVVASEVEVLNTAAFPKSVYIVLVNDQKQVILRKKVLI
jgi:hypothetical protein